jgi:hypothetical protein
LVGNLLGFLSSIVFFAIGSILPIASDRISNQWGSSLLGGTLPAAITVLVAAVVYPEDRRGMGLAAALLVTFRNSTMLMVERQQGAWMGASGEALLMISMASAWLTVVFLFRSQRSPSD